jgi:dihydrofolate reductase
MGKLVVTEFITVDGVIDSPGELGWVFKFNRGDEGDKFKFDELMSADAQLLGRITYQGFAQAWPSMGTDPFGARMNSMPKFVVSTTLSPAEATWENSTEYRLMVLFVGSTWSCAASSILIQRPMRTPGGAIAQSHNQGVRRYERIATRSWPARSR